jgi:Leucine-rich repeat (LRR) protein
VKNVPSDQKYTKRPSNIPNEIPNDSKVDQMSIKYNNIVRSKALQNLPKLEFFGLKKRHLATRVSTD